MISNIFVGFFVLFSSSHVFANSKEKSKAALACEDLFFPENIEKMCCTSVDQYIGETKKCEGVLSDEYTCDKAICSLDKIDVLDAKNEVDETKYEEYLDNIEKENPNEKSTIYNIKKHCLGGQFMKYPSPADDNCASMKLQMCTFLHSTVECTAWKSDYGCGELATSAAECRPYLNQILEKMLH